MQSTPPSKAALQDLNTVRRLLAFQQVPFQLVASPEIQFASAINNLDDRGPAIAYNPKFLAAARRRDKWAAFGILAHEFGHFASKQGQNCGLAARELAADRVVGCVFALMNAPRIQATSFLWRGLRKLPNGQLYNPPRKLRERAVLSGYQQCEEARSAE